MNTHCPDHPAPRTLPLLVSLACLGMLGAAQAQPGPQAHATLPTVVVSSTQNNLLADDLPLSADVIEGQNLSDQQTRTLRQALQDLPNTSVRSSPTRLAVSAGSAAFARDGNMGINIRGLGGNRVLMTVDGIRMPRSYVSRAAMFDREYLSLELFKRVDVIRGPASAQYGGDGMAGVVNFVTHDPMDFLKTEEGQTPKTLGGRVAAGWSEDDHGYYAAGTVAAKASDSLQWMLTATGRQSHALDNMGSNDAPNSTRTRPDPTDNQDASVLGKLVLRDMLERQQEEEEGAEGVQMMTMHASKGLEFPSVYIIGFEEEILPHRSSIEADTIEEERRLAYVGITRAKRNLALTFAAKRKQYGEIIDCSPSRFLDELPQEDLVWEGQEDTPVEVKTARGNDALASMRAMLKR